MLKNTKSLSQKDALVAFPSAADAKALGPQLDEAFGLGGWSAVALADAEKTLETAASAGAVFFVLGVLREEAEVVDRAAQAIAVAKSADMRVILLAESLSPAGVHRLMRAGADDFAPLPLPAAALADSAARLRFSRATTKAEESRNGLIYPVYGVAGGVGATTFSVNLAWELAHADPKSDTQVALLDFNFQYGSVATYLDLPRREAIYELLSDTSTLDEEGLGQALTAHGEHLSVLTAPMDVLPLDIIGPEDVRLLISLVRRNFDYVVIDLPQTLTHWSDLVLTEAEEFFAMMQSDMRSAQNMLRFLRAVKAEELPIEKVSLCLNKSPTFTDLSGKNRVHRLEKSLGVDFKLRLPDGGKQVGVACDHGAPLMKAAKNNPLRKEIRKFAQRLLKVSAETKAGAAA